MNEFHFTNEKLNCMIIYYVSDFPTQNLLLNHPSQYVQKRKKETLFLSKGSAPSNPQNETDEPQKLGQISNKDTIG